MDKIIDIDDRLKKAHEEYIKRATTLNNAREIVNYLNTLDLESILNIWIDSDGINFTLPSMYKKDIMILCDELFWSNDVETSDILPYLDYGELILKVYPHGEKNPGLWITFNLKEGEGCSKVRVGTKETPKYEWICG